MFKTTPAPSQEGNMRICVVGIGYIGLPCAIMLADAGCKVECFDINEKVVNAVNDGTIYVETALRELLETERVRENLKAYSYIRPAEVFIVAVPTPMDKQRKSANLAALKAAVASVATVVKKDDLVIVESTVPPMTMKNLVSPILTQSGLRIPEDIHLAHCPERLLPGNIVYEIVHNNRIIGGYDKQSAEMAAAVYQRFVKGGISLTDDVTAEICKLMENTYRDVNIALANELAEVCAEINVDIMEAIKLSNLHPRVNLLVPGIGVGGHCLPIDPWFIHEISPYHSRMIATARSINDARPARFAADIRKRVAATPAVPILLLGKTYKTKTDDIRESPAIEIYDILAADGYQVSAYDSEVDRDISLEELVRKAGYVFVLVPHESMMRDYEAVLTKISAEGKKPPATIPLT